MSSRARHAKSMPNNPAYVTGPLAGTVKDGVTKIHTVCMVCRTVIVDGPKRDGRSSHGLCGHPDCERITTEAPTPETVETMARRSEVAYGRYMTAPGTREDEPAAEAFGEWERCHRRFRTALELAFRAKNGPDGGASQRADSERDRPSGDDDSKVAGRTPDSNEREPGLGRVAPAVARPPVTPEVPAPAETGRSPSGTIVTPRKTKYVSSYEGRVARHRRIPPDLRKTIAWHMRYDYRLLKGLDVSRCMARMIVRRYAHMASLAIRSPDGPPEVIEGRVVHEAVSRPSAER